MNCEWKSSRESSVPGHKPSHTLCRTLGHVLDDASSYKPGRGLVCWLSCAVSALLFLLSVQAVCAHASVALLMEEPYGHYGAWNPTGHSAVYLNHVCAASPTELRLCRPGESGVVISRYHKIGGLDWVAIPLIPYLYAVDDIGEVPRSVDKAQVAALRDAYRRKYLESLAPDGRHGKTPGGEWVQLVGSAYDRTIHGFEVVSTPEQDARFIAIFNDRRNSGHFNIFFHNCADFSRVVMDLYFPGAVHRSIVADLGITTPKQVARSLVQYGRKHPELQMSAFVIPQVPGSIKRSRPIRGIAQMMVKSKRYLIPMTILAPELTGGFVVAYLTEGRMKLPENTLVFNVNDNVMQPEKLGAARSVDADPGRRLLPLTGGTVKAPDTVTATASVTPAGTVRAAPVALALPLPPALPTHAASVAASASSVPAGAVKSGDAPTATPVPLPAHATSSVPVALALPLPPASARLP